MVSACNLSTSAQSLVLVLPLAPAHCLLLISLGRVYDFHYLQVKLVNFEINWGWIDMSEKKRKIKEVKRSKDYGSRRKKS